MAEAARQHALTVAEVEDWRGSFCSVRRTRCGSRPRDEEAVKDEQIKKLKQKIGDLVSTTISYGRPETPCWTARHPTRDGAVSVSQNDEVVRYWR